jgi:hypothetical protein
LVFGLRFVKDQRPKTKLRINPKDEGFARQRHL